MARKEYQVARGFFRIDMARPDKGSGEDFGDEELVRTNVVPNYEMPWDALLVLRPGISCPDAIDMIKAVVVGLIEEGYLYRCPNTVLVPDDNLHLGQNSV